MDNDHDNVFDGEEAKRYLRADGRCDIYYGGRNAADGIGHGHVVQNSGKILYQRKPAPNDMFRVVCRLRSNFPEIGQEGQLSLKKLVHVTPDTTVAKVTNGDEYYVLVLTDYFDKEDIKKGFADKIRDVLFLFAYDKIVFLTTRAQDSQQDGWDLRKFAFPDEKYGWVLLAKVDKLYGNM